ncbi:hypothetical protein C8J57DRAFT_1253849 [Mycena rebaudengoi]|nr:hypothetical protein C8J57DRAFT_1253849 [Mycena rebaudengoi]
MACFVNHETQYTDHLTALVPQKPTCCGLRVSTLAAAQKVMLAVYSGLRPLVTRRLDDGEKRLLDGGQVYVWEERLRTASAGEAFARFKDGRSWLPPVRRGAFLCYTENMSKSSIGLAKCKPSDPLIKLTCSAVLLATNAYYFASTELDLATVDTVPDLKNLDVPPGIFQFNRQGHEQSDEKLRRTKSVRPRIHSLSTNEPVGSWGISATAHCHPLTSDIALVGNTNIIPYLDRFSVRSASPPATDGDVCLPTTGSHIIAATALQLKVYDSESQQVDADHRLLPDMNCAVDGGGTSSSSTSWSLQLRCSSDPDDIDGLFLRCLDGFPT